jgi:uncharacterized protein YraI
MNETFARAIIFALMCLALVLVWKAVRGLWRAITNVRVGNVARAAGAITAAAEGHAARARAAFKDGRGR